MKSTSISMIVTVTLALVFMIAHVTASTPFDTGKAAIISEYRSSSSGSYDGMVTDLITKPQLKSDVITTYKNSNKNLESVFAEQYKITLSSFFFGGVGGAPGGGGGGGMGVF
jgi:hypothetical protein